MTKPLTKKHPGTAVMDRRGAGKRFGKTVGGVVSRMVYGRAGKTSGSYVAPSRLIHEICVGLPVRELEDLQAALGVPMTRLAGLLGISPATLHRRKAGRLLGTVESDRVVRYARLLRKAIEVLESEVDARRWLSSPQVGLGGEAPLDYALTEVGAREVEDLLGRIEHGVYS